MPTTVIEVGEILGTLLEMFPSFRRTMSAQDKANMFKAYHLILGDLDVGDLKRAAAHIVTNATFFPSAGELRRAYFDLRDTAQGVPSAQDAWKEITSALHRGFSRYNPPRATDFSHSRVFKALEGIGGWLVFCDSENIMSDRARFIESYNAYTSRDQEIERMLPAVREMIQELADKMGDTKRLGAGDET